MASHNPRPPSARVASRASDGQSPPVIGVPSPAPWTSQHETELRRDVEADLNYWRQRARNLENQVRTLRAAAQQQEGAVSFMEPTSGNMYTEAAILRQMVADGRRWDEGNWSELCALALKGCNPDKLPELKHTVAFQAELRRLREEILKESAEHLAAHAYHPGKFMLAKYALRASDRGLGWLHSTVKNDHSARGKDGVRVRKREMMAKGSQVRIARAPRRSCRSLCASCMCAPVVCIGPAL